jgi:hypothetical protein
MNAAFRIPGLVFEASVGCHFPLMHAEFHGRWKTMRLPLQRLICRWGPSLVAGETFLSVPAFVEQDSQNGHSIACTFVGVFKVSNDAA